MNNHLLRSAIVIIFVTNLSCTSYAIKKTARQTAKTFNKKVKTDNNKIPKSRSARKRVVYRKGQGYTIGRSVLKRRIVVYKFGLSNKKIILIIAGTHGNEKSAVKFARSLLHYYWRYPYKVPRSRQLWVLPIANPDGYFNKDRLNANAVDLNRNFDTKNWQAETVTNKSKYPEGGGKSALSEPEARAMANLINENAKQIDYIVNIHCCAGIVEPNLSMKRTIELSKYFAKKTKYKLLIQNWSDSNYPITGSFSKWIYEKHKLGDVFIELGWGRNARFQKLKWPFLTMLHKIPKTKKRVHKGSVQQAKRKRVTKKK